MNCTASTEYSSTGTSTGGPARRPHGPLRSRRSTWTPIEFPGRRPSHSGGRASPGTRLYSVPGTAVAVVVGASTCPPSTSSAKPQPFPRDRRRLRSSRRRRHRRRRSATRGSSCSVRRRTAPTILRDARRRHSAADRRRADSAPSTIEGDWPDARRVDRFVRAVSSDADADMALAGFRRFPQWMWRNAVVLRFRRLAAPMERRA